MWMKSLCSWKFPWGRGGQNFWIHLRKGNLITPTATVLCSDCRVKSSRGPVEVAEKMCFQSSVYLFPSSGPPRQLILCSPTELLFLSSIFLLLAPALYVLSQTSMLYWHTHYHFLWPIKMCLCLCSWKWVPISPRQHLACELVFRWEVIRSYQGSGFTASSETKRMHDTQLMFSVPERYLQHLPLLPLEQVPPASVSQLLLRHLGEQVRRMLA